MSPKSVVPPAGVDSVSSKAPSIYVKVLPFLSQVTAIWYHLLVLKVEVLVELNMLDSAVVLPNKTSF